MTSTATNQGVEHAHIPCCERMDQQLNFRCPEHADPSDCPDALVSYSTRSGRYGLRIHDGGSACIEIDFCPWCGTRLN